MTGWTMEIYDSPTQRFEEAHLKASIPMMDNVYLAFEGVAAHNYGAIPSWKWTREEMKAGLRNPLSTEVRSVYAIAEAIRFDWMRNRMATIFDVDRKKFSNAGFKTPKEHILNNWSCFNLGVGISEAETKECLDEPSESGCEGAKTLQPFEDQWFPANMPYPSGYESNGDPKEMVTPVARAVSDDEDEEEKSAS